jgi:hypothetical protein
LKAIPQENIITPAQPPKDAQGAGRSMSYDAVRRTYGAVQCLVRSPVRSPVRVSYGVYSESNSYATYGAPPSGRGAGFYPRRDRFLSPSNKCLHLYYCSSIYVLVFFLCTRLVTHLPSMARLEIDQSPRVVNLYIRHGSRVSAVVSGKNTPRIL